MLCSISIGYLFYRKERTNTKIALILTSLRSLSLGLILFLFLSPILKCNHSREQKPIVAVIMDHSKSMSSASKVLQNDLKKDLISKIFDMSNKEVEFKFLDLEREVISKDSFAFANEATNLFQGIQNVLDRYYYENLTAVYMITDGNYNQGNHPMFVSNGKHVPISVVLIGDTTKINDLAITNVVVNPQVLSDEEVQVQVSVQAYSTQSVTSELVIQNMSKGTLIAKQTIPIKSGDYSNNMELDLGSFAPGNHHIQIRCQSIIGEKNLSNNVRDIYIEVIDGKRKVYLAYSFPHPDIAALKSVFKNNKTVHLSEGPISNCPKDIDLLISYQYPNALESSKEVFDRMTNAGTSILFIFGTQTDYAQLNKIQDKFYIEQRTNLKMDIRSSFNDDFSLFSLRENTIQTFNSWPPISNFHINIKHKNESSVLLHQNIGNSKLKDGLIGFSQDATQKLGFLMAENFWKWKMSNYQTFKNFDSYNDLFDRIINYLATKKNRKQLVTQSSYPVYSESEQVKITANTYNDIMQSVRPDKIDCQISSTNSAKKTMAMLPMENSYIVKPSGLSAGDYMYQVTATIRGKEHIDKGFFKIISQNIEDVYLPANIQDMYALTTKFNGKLYLNDFSELRRNLSTHKYSSQYQRIDSAYTLIDLWPYLLAVLILLSCEWLIRKYFGLN